MRDCKKTPKIDFAPCKIYGCRKLLTSWVPDQLVLQKQAVGLQLITAGERSANERIWAQHGRSYASDEHQRVEQMDTDTRPDPVGNLSSWVQSSVSVQVLSRHARQLNASAHGRSTDERKVRANGRAWISIRFPDSARTVATHFRHRFCRSDRPGPRSSDKSERSFCRGRFTVERGTRKIMHFQRDADHPTR